MIEDVALDRKLVKEVLVEDGQNDEQKKIHAAGILLGWTSGVPIPIPKLSLMLTLICSLGGDPEELTTLSRSVGFVIMNVQYE